MGYARISHANVSALFVAVEQGKRLSSEKRKFEPTRRRKKEVCGSDLPIGQECLSHFISIMHDQLSSFLLP